MNHVQKEQRLLFDISTVVRTCLSTMKLSEKDRETVGQGLFQFLHSSQKTTEMNIIPEDVMDSLKKGDLKYCAEILQHITYKYGQVYTFPYIYLKSFTSTGRLQKIELIPPTIKEEQSITIPNLADDPDTIKRAKNTEKTPLGNLKNQKNAEKISFLRGRKIIEKKKRKKTKKGPK